MLDTVYSLSGEVPATDLIDDPGAAFEPASVALGSVRQVCQIRKISAGGAVLHTDLPIEEGHRLELELDNGDHLDGEVVWARGGEVGLRFDQRIDIFPVIARNLAGQPGERRRLPRIELACPALLESDGRAELVTTRDIAQGGVKLETPFPLAPEMRVVVTPDGLEPISGVVRWSRGRLAGIAFDREFGWQQLMPWLRGRSQAPATDFHAPIEAAAAPAQYADEPCVQLNLHARVREGLHRWTIDVESLTSRSIAFESFAPLRLGTLLWVALPGLEGWPARIVGNDGYRFTCEFTQPLHPAVLERILAAGRAQG